MTKAITGKYGYKGVLKGRGSAGSFFRKAITETIEITYKVNAPNTASMIMSPVFPVSSAMIPKIIFAISAFAGVLNLHGVEKEVELKGELLGQTVDPWGNDRIAFEAFTTLNRKEFGLTWNQVLESGGLLVGEKVEVILELQLIRAEEQADSDD